MISLPKFATDKVYIYSNTIIETKNRNRECMHVQCFLKSPNILSYVLH